LYETNVLISSETIVYLILGVVSKGSAVFLGSPETRCVSVFRAGHSTQTLLGVETVYRFTGNEVRLRRRSPA
jgi:hypothetical protein